MQIIQLHALEMLVNTFNAEATLLSLEEKNKIRSSFQKANNYIIDHICEQKTIVPYKSETGVYIPNIENPTEYEQFRAFFDSNIKTPINLLHPQANNRYSNLMFLPSKTNTSIKTVILDKVMGLYAGIDHENNIFVITFYTDPNGFYIETDVRTCIFSVLYELPTDTDILKQIELQAEAVSNIYKAYNQVYNEIEEMLESFTEEILPSGKKRYNSKIYEEPIWNKVKASYIPLMQKHTIRYLPTTAPKKQDDYQFGQVFFDKDDERIVEVKSYTDFVYWDY